MELYEQARPEVFSGHKILFVHGFASSGQNGSVKTLRTLLPEAEIIAPDVPVEPAPAMEMLQGIVDKEQPSLVIGTSMGAMYAEQLRGDGLYKILVNPAFNLADTILKNNGLGRQEFHNPRADGQKDFLVTKGLLEEFRAVSEHEFEGITDEDDAHTWLLFGREDHLVTGTFEQASAHYSQCIWFPGEHYLNDTVLVHSVFPVIQWAHDANEGKEKRSIFVAYDDVLRYCHNGEEVAGATKALHTLDRQYNIQFILSEPFHSREAAAKKRNDLYEHFGVQAFDRITETTRKDFILGDYMIDAHPSAMHGDEFMGTMIEFGSDTFKTWADVLTFFDRLNGQ